MLRDLPHPECKIKCCGEGGKPWLFIKANTIKHISKITECFDPSKYVDRNDFLSVRVELSEDFFSQAETSVVNACCLIVKSALVNMCVSIRDA